MACFGIWNKHRFSNLYKIESHMIKHPLRINRLRYHKFEKIKMGVMVVT